MIPKQTNRLYIPLTDINAEGRIRADYGDIDGLCDSLSKYGLMQPVVINQSKRLIAGGRRLKAHQLLNETEIAVVFYETLNDLQLRVLEVEENIQRKDFDWREKVLAIDTANTEATRDAILHKDFKSWGQAETGALLGIAAGSVNSAVKLAKYIRAGDKEIVEAANAREAFQVLLLRKEREGQKRLAAFITEKAAGSSVVTAKEVEELLHGKDSDDGFFANTVGGSGGGVSPPRVDELPGQSGPATRVSTQSIPLTTLVQKGDCFTLMSAMPPESVDHIITDIPYGIDMENLNNVETVKAEHDVASNVDDFNDFMAETYRVLRSNAFLIFWCDVHHWEKLRDAAYAVGYKVQRWPLIWDKTSPCQNNAAQFNWTKSAEVAMVCRKGTPTLLQAQSRSVWSGPNTNDLDHPFAKPTLLWQWLLRAVALPGQTILDPYAGVGSLALAAIPLGLVAVSYEINEHHYNKLLENVQNAYKKLDPNIVFT